MHAGNIRNAVIGTTFQTPLSQIVSCNNNESLLVTDPVNCDGRFVLYTVAAAALNSNQASSTPSSVVTSTTKTSSIESKKVKSRVLWISCTSVTTESIFNAFKKIGLDRDVISSASRCISGYLNSPTAQLDGVQDERLQIHSVVSSIAEATIYKEEEEFDNVIFIKELYARIKAFVSNQNEISRRVPTIVIIDDVSALAVLVGERLVYSLVLSLNALKLNELYSFGLVVRCSNDYDMNCSSSGTIIDPITTISVPWERSLVELVDSVIDVTLLPSGYSRDVHGRLAITSRRTVTTDSSSNNTGIYNFCHTDHQVLVMRLATT